MVSCFLLTGGGISFVIDLYFSKYISNTVPVLLTPIVWTYSNGLELNSPRFTQPGDFFTYVVFVASVILVSQTRPIPYPLHPHISARPVSFS
jgi:hypothetical protein